MTSFSRLGQDLGKTWALPESDTQRHTRPPYIGGRVSLSRGRLGHRQDLGGHARPRPPMRLSRRRAVTVVFLLVAMKALHRALRACAKTVDHLEGRT